MAFTLKYGLNLSLSSTMLSGSSSVSASSGTRRRPRLAVAGPRQLTGPTVSDPASGLRAGGGLRPGLRGHHATIREAADKPGGDEKRYGIPCAYRLPRYVLDAEIDRILALGVESSPSAPVAEFEADRLSFDAVFLAVGAHVARNVEPPGGTAAHVIDAISMLHGIEDGETPQRPEGRRLRWWRRPPRRCCSARRLRVYERSSSSPHRSGCRPAPRQEAPAGGGGGATAFRWLDGHGPARLVVPKPWREVDGGARLRTSGWS